MANGDLYHCTNSTNVNYGSCIGTITENFDNVALTRIYNDVVSNATVANNAFYETMTLKGAINEQLRKIKEALNIIINELEGMNSNNQNYNLSGIRNIVNNLQIY